MDSFNYIATVHKPTVATHSAVGNFTSVDHLSLIVAKHNLIEIYDFSEARLRLLKDFPVNGGIKTLKLVRLRGQTREFLFLGTERYENSSFNFFVLSWDADKYDLITRGALENVDHTGEGERICFFNHDCSLIGLRTLSSLSDGQPLNSVEFVHLTHEGQIETDFSIRFRDVYQNVLWEEPGKILDIKFLHSSETMLAVLYEADQTWRKVATYIITPNEDSEDDELLYDSYSLVKGPWSTHTRNSEKLLIPIPQSCDGILAVGEKTVTYCSKSMPVEEHFLPGFVFESLRNQVHGSKALHYDFGDIVYITYTTGGLRFLFSGQNRNLQMLTISQNDKKDVQLKLELLGETTFASTLSYLCDDVLYVGSRSGDSQLIKLKLEPSISVAVLESFLNLGLVSDCCVAVLDQQSQLVTCSGGYKDGSLRILRKNFQIKEMRELLSEGPAIEGMWCLKHSKDDKYDSLLIVTLLHQTIVSGVDTEISGFSTSEQTLLCHNVVGSIVTQVTPTSVRLICLRSGELKCVWNASDKIIRASAIHTEVLVATMTHLYYLEIVDNSLQLKETRELDLSITSLVVAPDDAKYAAVGTWHQNSIMIYSLPELTVQSVRNLQVQPRSLVICSLEEISYLFCGTGEGNVVYFILDTATGELAGMRTVSFGSSLVTLHLIAHKNTKKVFIASDQPAIIYSSSKNLYVSSVNRRGINQICSLSTSSVPSSVAIAIEGRVTIEDLDDLKIDVHSVHLCEQPLSIAYQRQSQTFTVACVKYSELSETSIIRLLNARTFDILDSYTFGPSPFGVIYGVSLLSCEFDGDDQEYVCVGTEGIDSLGRSIKVFVIRKQRLEVVSETRMLLRGSLFCMAAFNGMLLAGYGGKFAIFRWDPFTRDLLQMYELDAVGRQSAYCLQCQGNSIFGGKLAQLMHFKERVGIESVAHNESHSLTAVDILKADVYVGATSKHSLLFFDRNEENGLQVVGQYDLGDQVSRFCHGSLVSAGENEISTTLFSTINGGIGLLASLPEQSYGVLQQLQGLLRRDLINRPDARWRLFYHNMQPEHSNLLDGDLIKSFSDMEISAKSDIAKEMGMSVEDIDNKVNEVTHFH